MFLRRLFKYEESSSLKEHFGRPHLYLKASDNSQDKVNVQNGLTHSFLHQSTH
jgi:hypothetical protein